MSIFILLTRRKATETLYIGQAITRCQDIAVQDIEFLYFSFFSFIEI